MAYLLLYGSQNLSNKKFIVNNAGGLRSTVSTIQRISNARSAGSTVVDKKIEEKEIVLPGVITATSELTLIEVINEYKKAFNKEDRYFRVSTDYKHFTDMTSDTGWQVLGDATSRSFDTTSFQHGDGSVMFNADVSLANSSCGLMTENATQYDISQYLDKGCFEFWIYLPQSEGVTSINLEIGNNASNNYNAVITKQYDGTLLENGWNYCNVEISSMNELGTVDPYSFGSYIEININYSSMTDRSDFRLGGVLVQNDTQSINFKSYVGSFNPESNYYNTDYTRHVLTLLAYKGIGESSVDHNVYASTDNVSATLNGMIDLEGSYSPLPVLSLKINSATNVSGVTFSNTSTGDSIFIDHDFLANEILTINTQERKVTINGSPVNYEDLLPRFELGENSFQFSIQTTGEETVEQLVQDINLIGEV